MNKTGQTCGINTEVFEQLKKLQNGRCKTCLSPLTDDTRHIIADRLEMCSDTPIIKGLLCADCKAKVEIVRYYERLVPGLLRYLST